jgi:hypothetical protein
MQVCDNVGDHLIGNVYARYEWETEAQAAVDNLNNRWYAGKYLWFLLARWLLVVFAEDKIPPSIICFFFLDHHPYSLSHVGRLRDRADSVVNASFRDHFPFYHASQQPVITIGLIFSFLFLMDCPRDFIPRLIGLFQQPPLPLASTKTITSISLTLFNWSFVDYLFILPLINHKTDPLPLSRSTFVRRTFTRDGLPWSLLPTERKRGM